MFDNKQLLSNLIPTKYDKYVLVAKGVKAKINGIGKINLCNKQIKNVLYLETFPIDLLSINKLTKKIKL